MEMISAQKTIYAALLVIIGLLEASQATVHNVGDSAGWTILGHVDYKKWASANTFHAGDSLLFVYNSKFHNVKQVSHQDFSSCNASSPVATYTSGSDTVALKKSGHYYFLCGFPGHCQAGQKLDVLVTPSSKSSANAASPTAAPAPSPSAGSPSDSAASAPDVSAQNGAISSSVPTILVSALIGLVVYVVDLM